MGMFDDLTVEYPLPDIGKAQVREWQTKDLSRTLDRYRLTNEGILLRETTNGVMPVNYHGYLEFYGNDGDGDPRGKEWFEYCAKFVDGKCVHIERVPNV